MDIEILYVAECPNLAPARRHLDAALRVAGVTADVREIEVADPEAAARTGMRGSPTVMIDGHDAVPTDATPGSMSCRLYAADGVLYGAPSLDQLTDALARSSPSPIRDAEAG